MIQLNSIIKKRKGRLLLFAVGGWFVFMAMTARKMPETHLLIDGITSSYEHSIIADHHNPLAVAIKHNAVAQNHHERERDRDHAPGANIAHDDIHNGAMPQQQQQQQQQSEDSNRQFLAANHKNSVHPVAGLDCTDHDGPMDPNDSKEVVYWKDIPEDNTVISPFKKRYKERKYLSFEPDAGGWNNIRMSMETVLAMAVAMGRVLVLPPSQKMYLLGKTTFNFADFFPLQELASEHEGLEIITTEQFLEETMGKLLDATSSEVSFPPGKKTNWDGDTTGIKQELGPWLRSVALMPDCDPTHCIFGFPQSVDSADAHLLQQTFQDILREDDGKYAAEDSYQLFLDKPTPVDAPYKDRLKEMMAGRKAMLVYDTEYQVAPLIHFHGKSSSVQRKQHHGRAAGVQKPDPGGRLLVHFYAFLFFQDWRADTWTKRFVRDHLRYVDHVQCAAARIVHKLRTTHGGSFDSFHIRRGDFQYKKTRVEATEIVDVARDVIPEGRVVYVGTDERDKNFFKPLVEDAGWNVFYLDDFKDLLGDSIDPHYYGMIDQLVVSRGDRFFGCWFSTFTGYIMRLRGYHSLADIDAGHPDADAFKEGKLPHSYFYALKDSKTKMHQYWPVKKAFYAREFPTAWRQIDAM